MKENNLTLILSAPPEQAQAASGYGLPVAHMAYRMGSGPRLLHHSLSAAVRGGLMMMDDRDYEPANQGQSGSFVREVLRECSARSFSGVVLNWETAPSPAFQQMVSQLANALRQSHLTCYVPERWAKAAPSARILLPSALSGGSLRSRIQEAADAYGLERLTLAIERSAEEFLLPAPQGQGISLSQAELQKRLNNLRPRTFFSPELCAHYFTWQGRDGRARFVLFDNESSLRQKLQTARELGAPRCMMAYPEVAELLPSLLQ
ncbi:MAG: hypothetical protein LUD79_02010 [Oscillospiraceae bacterium]|nr:hypothetical protein [Oscillospiraceae bacterium]